MKATIIILFLFCGLLGFQVCKQINVIKELQLQNYMLERVNVELERGEK